MSDIEQHAALSERVAQGQAATRKLAELDPFIAEAMAAVDKRVYTLIASEGLSPQAALSAWHEKFALHQLIATLEKKVRQGATAAERLAPTKEIKR